jgi:hypothetical protein
VQVEWETRRASLLRREKDASAVVKIKRVESLPWEVFANRVATTTGETAVGEVVDVGGGIGEEEPMWDVRH